MTASHKAIASPFSNLESASAAASRPVENPLAGLRVAITGGTSGLGLALVRALLQGAAHVAFVARDRGRLERLSRELIGGQGICSDISRKEDIHPLAMQIVGMLGGLEVLINNASNLGPTPLALLADTECEDFERALATNVLGPFRLTKALLGSLAASAREGRGAVVVNISTDAAVNAYARWGAYSASKAALRHLSAVWNEELIGERVRVISFDPGDMDTPMHAAALPDADRTTLKRPDDAAHELVDVIVKILVQQRADPGRLVGEVVQ
jgi:NAD(P)-dependent dehydrogenase (short-subunit alcohol dehydrogenase family)